MTQTTVQHRKTVRSGSGTVSIGTRFDNMVNIGACRGIGIKETMTSTDIESDNAGVISTLLSEHKAEITFDSLELNLRNYYLARGGIDNLKDYDGYTEAERKYIVESGSYEKGEIIRVPWILFVAIGEVCWIWERLHFGRILTWIGFRVPHL